MATTSNNPNARYDAGPNAAGCGRVATQAQLQAEAETGLLGDSNLSGAAFRVGFAAAGIRNVNTGGNVAGASEAPRAATGVPVDVDYRITLTNDGVTDYSILGASDSGFIAVEDADSAITIYASPIVGAPVIRPASNATIKVWSCVGAADATEVDALTDLEASYQGLTAIDFADVTALQTLYISSNADLASLDVSKLTALRELDFGGSQIATINLTGLTALEILYCGSTQLTSLDVSGFAALQICWCGYCQLTSLSLDGAVSLNELYVGYNPFSSETIDAILATVDGFGTSGPGRSLDATGAAAPGASGLAAKANLIARGWTVVTA